MPRTFCRCDSVAERVATLIEALHDLEQRLKVTHFDHESAGLDLPELPEGTVFVHTQPFRQGDQMLICGSEDF